LALAEGIPAVIPSQAEPGPADSGVLPEQLALHVILSEAKNQSSRCLSKGISFGQHADSS
jgi:hypothetical protein